MALALFAPHPAARAPEFSCCDGLPAATRRPCGAYTV